jgi:hypothetical protein
MAYSPIYVRNPTAESHLIRLLPGQKMILKLSRPEFMEAIVSTKSDLLMVSEEIQPTFRLFTFSQNSNLDSYWKCHLFLGEIVIKTKQASSSLCMMLEPKSSEGYCIQAINPDKQQCQLEAHQFLDIVYIVDNSPTLDCMIVASQKFKLEQLDYHIGMMNQAMRMALADSGVYFGISAEEHRFRFRFDESSTTAAQDLAWGKYSGGSILFYDNNDNNEFYTSIDVIFNWKKRKLPICNIKPKKKKLPSISQVTIVPLQYTDMEKDCNIIFSKCS